MYRERAVAEKVVRAALSLDYPREKLDIKLLLEEDDPETLAEIRAAEWPSCVETIIVPHGSPKTKPKACNHGLLAARGEYLVIYDAEDRPEPDQLKKAICAFRRVDPRVVCLQAKLNYYNPRQNHLTRFFTLEYTSWFDLFLPGLHVLSAPIPLGGTSNHFRVKALRDLGGWDPFNVTEDCDLGIRLHREGYRTAVLDSTTWEEANSRLFNWIRQRSRWVKGYIQTHLVHTRPAEPRRMYASLFMLLVALLAAPLALRSLLPAGSDLAPGSLEIGVAWAVGLLVWLASAFRPADPFGAPRWHSGIFAAAVAAAVLSTGRAMLGGLAGFAPPNFPAWVPGLNRLLAAAFVAGVVLWGLLSLWGALRSPALPRLRRFLHLPVILIVAGSVILASCVAATADHRRLEHHFWALLMPGLLLAAALMIGALIWRLLQTTRRLGPFGATSFGATVGGLSMMLLLNPVYWIILLVFSAAPWQLWYARTTAEHYSDVNLYGALFSGDWTAISYLDNWSFVSQIFFLITVVLLLSNLVFILVSLAACLRRRLDDLYGYALLVPLYWILISVAAWKGFIQLFTRAHYWEKTIHGLAPEPGGEGSPGPPGPASRGPDEGEAEAEGSQPSPGEALRP